MDKHNGKIVEYQVRRNGFSITALARELNVSRRTIYNFFNSQVLNPEIILKIGEKIGHDFSKEFPHFLRSGDFIQISYKSERPQITEMDGRNRNEDWKTKYLILLERYNKTLLSKTKLDTAV